ncbi:eukaryotic rRNA processing protein EBP2-domain-containing protein [Phascolomyces articulosus]|uniref:Eukaryotic rRNA processing protein EBP2-domain-containing protein n=1 Tax=Phascolomyces articulosus TaxID=60185 RepID=A0AAD5PE61_9FUNG|nr:eukaryotic rRNA processing protein EBP2-domain-containing protein [Phascolomyces articulosus]
MGIKTPSKAKLRRLLKREEKEKEKEKIELSEQVANGEIDEENDDDAPEAVPLEEQSSDLEDDIEGSDDEEDDNVNGEEKQQPTKKELRPRINDEEAMIRITEEFKLKKLPWFETMSVTSSKSIEIPDIKDDMARELAFYQQALEAVKIGREKVLEAGMPFSRPDDYFAEMIKSEEHMAKVRQKLLDESAQLKASEDAKRQRLLKKYGKKVQVEKQLERQKQKTDTLEKIKLLKRSMYIDILKGKGGERWVLYE